MLSELDGLVAELHAAGLLRVGRDGDGHATWALTPLGAKLARLVALWGEADTHALLTAVLDAAEADPGDR
jgi:hypothetical protein